MSEASSELEEVVGKADEILKKVELAVCEELNADLNVSKFWSCLLCDDFYVFYTSLISV